jgi:hypothetical protein
LSVLDDDEEARAGACGDVVGDEWPDMDVEQ